MANDEYFKVEDEHRRKQLNNTIITRVLKKIESKNGQGSWGKNELKMMILELIAEESL